MEKITDKNYREFIGKKDGRLKALKIGATWCRPCHLLDKIMPDIEQATPETDWGKADMDDNPKMTDEFSIMAVPQIIFFKNGKRLRMRLDKDMDALVGLYPKDTIISVCKKLC